MTKKPNSIINGCVGIGIIAAFSLSEISAPAGAPESTQNITSVILLGIAVYILGIATVWSRKTWGRWLLVLWFFTPMFIGAYTDAIIMEADFNQLLGQRLFQSWVSWLYIFSLVSLFLPASSEWLKGDKDDTSEAS